MAEQLEFSFHRSGEIPSGYVETVIRYAHAGGPPSNWWELAVIDLDTGKEIENVVEAYADTGHVIAWTDNDFFNKTLRRYNSIAICKRAG